jgi:hypothetical protein
MSPSESSRFALGAPVMGRRWDQGLDQGFPNRASGSTGTPSNWQHWHHTLHGCTGSSTGKPDQLVRYENRKLCYMGQKAKHVFGSATGRPWHLISRGNAGITRYDGMVPYLGTYFGV